MSGKENKKILVFLNHWAAQMGGAEHSLLDILEHKPDTCECHLISTESGILHTKAEKLGITCHIVPCNAKVAELKRTLTIKQLLFNCGIIFQFLSYCFKLYVLINRIHPQLIHANIPKSHIALCILVFLGYKGKCIFHLREIFNHSPFAIKIYQLLFPKKNSIIIAISRAVLYQLPLSLRIHAFKIHNGVGIPPIRGFKECRNTLRLIYLGRIVPWKGCHILVEILDLCRTKYPDMSLTLSLIGDTSYTNQKYRDKLQKKIEYLGLQSYCTLSAHTHHPLKILLEHDIFCNASIHEPFGRSLVQAQACGLPVISFSGGATQEIIANHITGIVIPLRDRVLFAQVLYLLYKNPDYRMQLGVAARFRTLHRFNKNDQLPKVWQRLIVS